MRSFLAGLLVLLSFLTGVAALGGLVAHRTVLDPQRAGEVVERTLADRELRTTLLQRAVPGYGRLSSSQRAGIDALAETDVAKRAVRTVRLAPDGTVSLAPLQSELARTLRANGQDELAARVAAERAEVTVPSKYMTRYNDASDESARVALSGGLATLALVVLALLVSPRRLRTVRSIGLATVVAAGVVAAAFWLLPSLVRAYDSDPAYAAVASAVASQRSDMAVYVVPVAVVGLVLMVVGLLGGRRAR